MSAPKPDKPWVQITEQPKARGIRFRYACEGRSAGSIPGERSGPEKKTYPTIQVHGTKGPAVVVVSLVTGDGDEKPRPHPHSLVGKDCKYGVCTVKIKSKDMTQSFPGLGIQCVKKKEIESALKQRHDIRVDPFASGFHKNANEIDLQATRLCFQVFVPNADGKFTVPLAPLVSTTIFDRKNAGDLAIVRMDKFAGTAAGGDEVFMFTEKINKDDVKVIFCEYDHNHKRIWACEAEFSDQDVHKNFALAFKTPEYKDKNIRTRVEVQVILSRPSDGEVSAAKNWTFIPIELDPDQILAKRKRKRPQNYDNFSNTSGVKQNLQKKIIEKNRQGQPPATTLEYSAAPTHPSPLWNQQQPYQQMDASSSSQYQDLSQSSYQTFSEQPVTEQRGHYVPPSSQVYHDAPPHDDFYNHYQTTDQNRSGSDQLINDYDIGTLSDNQLLEILDQSEIDPHVMNLGLFQDSSSSGSGQQQT